MKVLISAEGIYSIGHCIENLCWCDMTYPISACDVVHLGTIFQFSTWKAWQKHHRYPRKAYTSHWILLLKMRERMNHEATELLGKIQSSYSRSSSSYSYQEASAILYSKSKQHSAWSFLRSLKWIIELIAILQHLGNDCDEKYIFFSQLAAYYMLPISAIHVPHFLYSVFLSDGA